jgi:hypothetical protein
MTESFKLGELWDPKRGRHRPDHPRPRPRGDQRLEMAQTSQRGTGYQLLAAIASEAVQPVVAFRSYNPVPFRLSGILLPRPCHTMPVQWTAARRHRF